MKPRTKREVEVLGLSSKLKPMTQSQEAYYIRHCFEHNSIKRKKSDTEHICLECGKVFEADADAKTVVCPSCHKKLDVKVSRRKNLLRDMQSFQILATAGDYQIVRTFYVVQYTMPHQKAEYIAYEVSRIFIQPNKSDIVLALARRGLTGYVDAYIWDSDLAIRRNNSVYEIHATEVYPRQSVLPILQRNGWCKKVKQFAPVSTIHHLMNESEYETLAKVGRFDIWKELSSYQIREHWQQIKIMIRHDYRPKDLRMWYDTVCIASNLGLDINSPKYILPAELKEMHDMLNRRAERKRKKEEQERRRAEIAKKKKLEKWYFKYNGKLLGICIHSGDIDIKPLQNYKEFCDEGDSMHHCVETYWGRKDCLILSARSHGIRLATIELDRKDFHIKQCRAAGNEQPERFKEICDILEHHKKDFVRASAR